MGKKETSKRLSCTWHWLWSRICNNGWTNLPYKLSSKIPSWGEREEEIEDIKIINKKLHWQKKNNFDKFQTTQIKVLRFILDNRSFASNRTGYIFATEKDRFIIDTVVKTYLKRRPKESYVYNRLPYTFWYRGGISSRTSHYWKHFWKKGTFRDMKIISLFEIGSNSLRKMAKHISGNRR